MTTAAPPAPAADTHAADTDAADTHAADSPAAHGPPSAARVAAARWRSGRGALGLAAAVVALAVLGVLLLPQSGGRRLDPGSAGPQGARAVAQVLGDRGVEVQLVERADAAREAVGGSGADTTVVVVEPSLLDPALLEGLRGLAAEVVLVEPDFIVLTALDAPVTPAGKEDDSPASDPGCDAPAAVAAGRASGGGLLFAERATSPTTPDICYVTAGAGSWAQWSDGPTRYTVVGQAAVLTNDGVADRGNAALALRTLGTSPRLVWWYADPLDGATGGGTVSASELLPRWVGPVAVQLLLVALLAVLWRARRLGRLVPEPLPVVVRSAETSRGRAALYRRAGARDRAAAVLRADVLRRLAPRFGLRPGAAPFEVASGAAGAAGRPAGDVQQLLLGPPPATDLDLALLADALDDLVEDVTTAAGGTARPSPREPAPARPARQEGTST